MSETIKPHPIRSDYLCRHLPYEYNMLRHCYRRIIEPGLDYRDRNAFIESFAVHARNITDFFSNKAEHGNLKASHFVHSFRPEAKASLTGALQRLNVQVFHLGQDRPDAPQGKFSSSDAAAVLEWADKAMERFIAELDVYDRAAFVASLRLILCGEDPSPAPYQVHATRTLPMPGAEPADGSIS